MHGLVEISLGLFTVWVSTLHLLPNISLILIAFFVRWVAELICREFQNF